MLIIAATAMFMSAPGQSFSVAAFVDPMLHELGINRTSYSFAYMVATLVGGCILPFIGRIVDRFGARRVLPVVALGLGAACGWMSQVRSIVSLYIGFSMIRCLGQGSLTLISSWIVGEWFKEFRGRAAAICAVGGTASVLIIPQLNNALINAYGWRTTWMILGGIVCATVVIPAAIFLRDRPEAIGLLPDWKRSANDEAHTRNPSQGKPAVSDTTGFTVSEAIRHTSFWKIASVVGTVSLVGTGLMFHQVSILSERGVSREAALTALGVQAVAATFSTLLAGYLTDRLPVRFVLATSMALEICAILLLMFLPSPGWAYSYSALLGLHGGINRSAGTIVWINYFGRKHQGAIQGVSMTIMVFAAALGPVPVAMAKDIYGSYEAALIAFLVLPITAGVLVLSAKPPQARAE